MAHFLFCTARRCKQAVLIPALLRYTKDCGKKAHRCWLQACRGYLALPHCHVAARLPPPSSPRILSCTAAPTTSKMLRRQRQAQTLCQRNNSSGRRYHA